MVGRMWSASPSTGEPDLPALRPREASGVSPTSKQQLREFSAALVLVFLIKQVEPALSVPFELVPSSGTCGGGGGADMMDSDEKAREEKKDKVSRRRAEELS